MVNSQAAHAVQFIDIQHKIFSQTCVYL